MIQSAQASEETVRTTTGPQVVADARDILLCDDRKHTAGTARTNAADTCGVQPRDGKKLTRVLEAR